MAFFLRWLSTTLAILFAAQIVPGVHLSDVRSALAAALVLGVLNALIRPVLVLLTLPITVLSLGVFLLIINAFMFKVVSYVVAGLHVDSFGSAFLAALVVSIVSWLVDASATKHATITWRTHRRDRRTRGADDDVIELHEDRKGHWE